MNIEQLASDLNKELKSLNFFAKATISTGPQILICTPGRTIFKYSVVVVDGKFAVRHLKGGNEKFSTPTEHNAAIVNTIVQHAVEFINR